MTYKKQNINEFIAFKGLFNNQLSVAINSNDIIEVVEILYTSYIEETSSNVYVDTTININEIKRLYMEYIEDIKNDQTLLYKL